MKKLIVLATLAALPAVALADVTISGDIGVAVVNTKHRDKADKTSANTMDRQTGQIVFSGSDSVGSGVKAIWQIANRIDGAGNENANAWAGRDTFVGLESNDLGKLRIGRLSDPANSGYDRLEVFNELTIHGSGIGALAERRTGNTVRYDSPNYGGFEFAASAQLRPEHADKSFAFDPVTGNAVENTTAQNTAAHTWGIGAKYAAGPLTAKYSYTKMVDQALSFANTSLDPSAAVDTSSRVHLVNVGYAVNDLSLGLGYINAKTSQTAGAFTKETGWGVTAAYAMGQLTPKVSYWREGKRATQTGTVKGRFNVFTVGADYALSKRTSTGVELQYQGARKDMTTGEKTGKQNVSAVYLTTQF